MQIRLKTIASVSSLVLWVVGGASAEQGKFPAAESVGPRVVVDQPVYDFGVIAPQQVAEHAFVVRNTGDQYLVLEQVIASCKCVLPEDVAEGIQPGESAEVRVSFKGKPTRDRYAQSVKLKTNDPRRPEMVLRIVGKIAPDVVVTPGALLLPKLPPGKPAGGRVDVLTGVWSEFEITGVSTSNPLVEATATRLSPSAIRSRAATDGWSVEVQIAAERIEEDFEDQVYLTVQPTNPPGDPRTLKVPVVGSVRGRLTLRGPGLDQFGRIKFGGVDCVAGATKKFMAKVNDAQTELKVVRIETEPSYVRATFKPFRKVGSDRLYRLEVTVPPGALDSAYVGPSAGTLKVEFDHPRVKDLELAIEMLPAAPR